MINKRYGFSIVELMVAVVIIALMALAGFAVFKGFRKTTSVKVAARDVVNIMRLARQKAITSREDYYALYDITGNRVWVQSKSSYDSSGKNPDPGTEQILPERAVIDDVTGAGGSGPYYHTFTPESTLSGASGGVYLIDKDSKIKYRVTVINTTARARIYDSWE
jgi:prepilin-type N-terminal cleavage/methylation domain-containing protein